MKLKSFFIKIKYELVIFAALLAQMAVRVDWAHPVSTNFLTLYLIDFKVGFVSRAFIGSLIDLLTAKISERWLGGFILLTFAAVYFILALLFGKLIRSADGSMRNNIIFLVALYLFTCYPGRLLLNNIGLMDIYWFLFVLLAVICLQNKYAKWLVPLFCFFGLATHYAFALSFLPFIFVLLVIDMFNAKYKISAVLLSVASFLTAAGASVYFVFFANRFLKLDSNGTNSYLSSKASFPVWRYYVDGNLFYTDIYSGKKVNGIPGLLAILKQTAFEGVHLSDFAEIILLMLPLLLMFFLVWKTAFKLGKNKAEKFIFILCMLLPLPVLPSFIFSTDRPRFLGEILIVQFLTLFYLAYVKNGALLASLKKAENICRKYPMLPILLLIFSLSAFFFK